MPRSVQHRRLVQIDLNGPPEWFLNINSSATVELLAHTEHALDEQIANAYRPHKRSKGKSMSLSRRYGSAQRRVQDCRDLKKNAGKKKLLILCQTSHSMMGGTLETTRRCKFTT
jgi:hypothetical protein